MWHPRATVGEEISPVLDGFIAEAASFIVAFILPDPRARCCWELRSVICVDIGIPPEFDIAPEE